MVCGSKATTISHFLFFRSSTEGSSFTTLAKPYHSAVRWFVEHGALAARALPPKHGHGVVHACITCTFTLVPFLTRSTFFIDFDELRTQAWADRGLWFSWGRASTHHSHPLRRHGLRRGGKHTCSECIFGSISPKKSSSASPFLRSRHAIFCHQTSVMINTPRTREINHSHFYTLPPPSILSHPIEHHSVHVSDR